MVARGLLLALDYSPADGGIARLLDGWIVDTEHMEWLVLTTTSGPSSERVIRTTRQAMPMAATLAGRQWVRRADKRVVVAAHPYLSGLAVAVAKTSGARSACIAHGSELLPGRLAHRLALAPLTAVDVVVAISAYTEGRLLRRGWRRHPRVTVVHPTLRPPWLPAAEPARLPATGLRLVTISRLVDGYKNLDMLIRLCAVLHPLGVVESLTIIGGGPRLPALRTKAVELGLGDVVDFPGHLPMDKISSILAVSHVGLFASRDSMAENGFEGFGLVAHELAGAGLPVLAGAAGGTTEAVQAQWGRLLDPDDLWAWVEAIRELHANEAQRREMGAAGLAWANSIDPLASARAFARALLDEHPTHPRSGERGDHYGNSLLDCTTTAPSTSATTVFYVSK
jgi:glycosyltransferase involved in cell wall biosynthesis